MVLVAERDWLGTGYAGVSYVRRALEIHASPECKGKRKDPDIDRGPGNDVSAAMENLHLSGFSETAVCVFQPESLLENLQHVF
jgi:hypothetical protein